MVKTVFVFSIFCLTMTQAICATKLGVSGEFPSAKNYLIRAAMEKFEIYTETGLDVQNVEEIKMTKFSIGFGGDATGLTYGKLQSYLGGKMLLTLQHISIGRSSDTKSLFSIVPIIGLRYDILERLSLSYELQWEF
ncbi:MAG: hypothetical protein ACPL6C_01840, partial [bacterium]